MMNQLTRNTYIVVERHECDDVPVRGFNDRTEAYKFAERLEFGGIDFKNTCRVANIDDPTTPVCIAVMKFDVKGRVAGMDVVKHFGE